jgi:hypothetical protein
MTRPYDVERGIHDLFHARLRDPLLTETARLADKIADGFRADFDTTLDMETVGKALVIAAASVTPVAVDKSMPAAVIANLIGFAGENLVRTARVRAREAGGDHA